jgi:tetratricopeptide (TPR) repeat protein
MTTTQWDVVWQRARAGAHTIIIGQEPVPLAPSDLQMFWFSCDARWTTGGPLGEALWRLERLLGEDLTHATQVHEQGGGGLPSRLFDDLPVQSIDARFVDACNRLATWSECNVVLGFASLDAADEAAVTTFTQILRHPGWLHLPVIFTVQRVVQGPVSELIDVMRSTGGNDAVVEMRAQPQPLSPSAPFAWATLPPDVLRVLRAGSVIGSEFQVDLVARVLDEPVGTILEALQRAADTGAALVDRGEGRFYLPPDAIEALQAHMLPSLLTFWHARVGSLLSEEAAPRRDTTPSELPRVEDYAEIFEAAPVTDDAAPVLLTPDNTTAYIADHTQPPPVADMHTVREQSRSSRPETDQARAADHLQAAGQTEAAVRQYFRAAQEVAARGDARRALAFAQHALTLLDQLPPSEPRALLRARLLLVLGKVQWQSAILGTQVTLQDALASLDAAKTALPEAAPLEVAGELAVLTAGVRYDLGALDDLQQALGELTTMSRRWLEAGAPMQAACLLNDQAAIYVRLGDPVHAAHLLTESQKLFEAVLRTKPDDDVVVRELAATDHLLARLPLHTQLRPGREANAYAISLERALRAESAYQRLDQPRELARVWETIGRLELGRGRLEAAQGRLLTALQLQKQIGDVTGLARTTGALAEVYKAANRLGEAATLLADSVGLNFEKGSPIGLAFNRLALEALRQTANEVQTPETTNLLDMLGEIEHRLTQAERVLGQLTLPGEPHVRG